MWTDDDVGGDFVVSASLGVACILDLPIGFRLLASCTDLLITSLMCILIVPGFQVRPEFLTNE